MQLQKLLSDPLGLKNAERLQDMRLAREFSQEVFKLIMSKKYPDAVIVKTVDSILDDLPKKYTEYGGAIKAQLLKEIPYIPWTFKALKESRHQ